MWWIDWDTDAGTISAGLATGQTIGATLVGALNWHCVELSIDATNGESQLWINGLSAGSTTGSLTTLAARWVWLGGMFKDTAANGTFYLDEWVLADTYVGPVVVAPHGDYGNDPARWVLVYNTAMSGSADCAQVYRAARGLPWANLIGLTLSTEEQIDADAYAALVTAINSYLTNNGLSDQVMGVLLGYGVPGYINRDGYLDATSAVLHRTTTTVGYSDNALAVDGTPTRPTLANMNGLRLTARMDGATAAAMTALLEQATAIEQDGLGDGSTAKIYLDPFAGTGGQSTGYTQQMVDWGQSVDCMRTRLPIVWSAAADANYPDVDFDTIANDGFFLGWSDDANPPTGFYASPAGTRVLSVQTNPDQATATTLRSGAGSAGNWIEAAVAGGYAAAVASARACSPSSLPYARPLFEALRQGWSLAEAWFVAMPVLGDGFYLVGDPLMTIAMPKAGWDVFGPMDDLSALIPASPAAALRDQTLTLALNDDQQPAEGAQQWYVVRHLDSEGRSDGSTSAVTVAKHNGDVARAALSPAWPRHSDWALQIDDDQLVAHLQWDRALRACAVTSVQLTGEVDGGTETSVWAGSLDMASWSVQACVSPPTVSGRYRWQVTSVDGVVWVSPWSMTVRPDVGSGVALPVVEVQP